MGKTYIWVYLIVIRTIIILTGYLFSIMISLIIFNS